MYTGFFGLTQEPFSIAPDPRYLYMSERHREALAHLLYGLQAGGGGFVLLTGEIGAGKTTLCRCLLEQVPRRCNVAYVFNPRQTALELLGSVCREFHVDVAPAGAAASLTERIDALNEYLLRTHAVGQRNVLIIDEAQSLSADVLEQLRLLTNLETSERKLLQIILIGQPELRGLLARPELAQLAQRVIARYHLAALSEAETGQYIGHRLAVAGGSGPVPFDRGALQRIHRLSRGVPRRINLLCDRALLGAYARQQRVVDRAIVAKAAGEVFDGDAGVAARPTLPRWALAGLALGGGAVLAGVVAGVGLRIAGRAGAPTTGAATAASAVAASASSASAGRVPAVASAASASGSASASTSPPAAEPQDAAAALPEAAWPAAHGALQALAARWPSGGGEEGAAASADDCGDASAARGATRCYSGRGSLALLRQLGRPVVLALGTGDAASLRYVVLTGLSPRSAQLQTRRGPVTLPLTVLAERWHGDFSTFWRASPPLDGVAAAVAAASSASASAPTTTLTTTPPTAPSQDAIDAWRAGQLAALRGEPTGATRRWSAEQRRRRVQAFQQLQGLEADGVVGPLTAMLLNQAAGVPEPRLLQTP